MLNSLISLRGQLRKRRQSLTIQQQKIAANNLYKQLAHHSLFRNAHHIAFYLAMDGEIDPYLLFKLAQRLKKKFICQ